jgi:predicted nucleotidyltransferase
MNNPQETSLSAIKAQILKTLDEMGISAKQIILFGSRARGDYSKNSDYDFLIITEKTFGLKEKMQIASAIRRALAELYVCADIIINSEEEVKIKKDRIGCVTRYALAEGIEI